MTAANDTTVAGGNYNNDSDEEEKTHAPKPGQASMLLQETRRCIGFNVSAPIAELETIDNAAAQAGVSRSEWMRRAARCYLSYVANSDSSSVE